MQTPGMTYDPNDIASLPSNVRRLTQEQRKQWCEEFNEKNRIVSVCTFCERQLREGEQIPHRLRHATNGAVRSAAGTVLALKPDEILEVLDIVGEMS